MSDARELACRTRGRRARLIAAALGCFVLAGCGDTSSTAPPPASTGSSAGSAGPVKYSVQLCSEAAEYQTSANAIATLDANAAGSDGVKTALLDLQTATNNLIAVAAAENQFGPQVSGLEGASASLNATIAELGGQEDVSANLGRITASVTAVEQAAKPIVDNVRPGCPSVPAAATPPTS
jgi:hypothetical protein